MRSFLTPLTINVDLSGAAGKTYDGSVASGTATVNIAGLSGVDTSKLQGLTNPGNGTTDINYATNSANIGSYSTGNGSLVLSGGTLYSVQNGYDISYGGSLTINPVPSPSSNGNSGTNPGTTTASASTTAGYVAANVSTLAVGGKPREIHLAGDTSAPALPRLDKDKPECQMNLPANLTNACK